MPVETFTSLDALKGHLKDYPDFAKNIAELEGLKAQSEQTKSSYPAAKVAYDQQMRDWNDKYGEQYKKTVQEWKAASQAPKANGEPGSRKPPAPPAPMPKAPIEVGAKLGLPTTLFNAMIHPIIPFGIKGVIWYQGESNTDMKIPAKPWSYDKAFAVMINDWRGRWKQGDFPFLFVQLASYGKGMENPVVDMENGFPVIREMQKSTLKLSNTGMAVAIDVGEQNDIHPKDKYDVGHRLALAARRIAYGEDLPFSGPLYDSMKVEGDTIRISFKHAGSGLKIGPHPKIRVDDTPQVPTELGAFAICGSDRNWLAATAKIDGSTVIVSNPEVKSPVAVRYGWSAFPDCHLYNNDGLPASPFRTDDWMGGQPHPYLPKQ
jgi:sialate O-acetylesterase